MPSIEELLHVQTEINIRENKEHVYKNLLDGMLHVNRAEASAIANMIKTIERIREEKDGLKTHLEELKKHVEPFLREQKDCLDASHRILQKKQQQTRTRRTIAMAALMIGGVILYAFY
jgi:hypothetical protein